jgi:ketosteroid isomerase-like protein
MKKQKWLLVVMVLLPSLVMSQSKGEMPFSSSSAEAKSLMRQALVNLWDAKVEDGVALLKQANEHDPNFALPYLYLNDEGTSNERWAKVASLPASADEKLLLNAVIAQGEGKPIDGLVEPLLKKYPNDKYLSVQIAMMYRNKNAKRSSEILENVIKRDANFALAYNLLGYFYMDLKDMVKAEKNFNKYVSLRPELANVYDSKADYLVKAGKMEEAIVLYEKAAAMDPKNMAISKEKADFIRLRVKYPSLTGTDLSTITSNRDEVLKAMEAESIDNGIKHYHGQAIEVLPNLMVNVGHPNIRTRWTDLYNTTAFPKVIVKDTKVEGVGSLAVEVTESVLTVKTEQEEFETNIYHTNVWSKASDGSWKYLIRNWQISRESKLSPLSGEDKAAIRRSIRSVEKLISKDVVITEKVIDDYASLYSPHAVEVYPNHRCNVGLANLRVQWKGLMDFKIEKTTMGVLGIDGYGKRAVAWGIMDHRYYRKNSSDLVTQQVPWVLIFTKEGDDAWRILVDHSAQ